jgi:predicted nucleotidyltransferase component of viral defense system
MMRAAEGLPVSIQVRLARRAKAAGLDPNLLLNRFAIERFLYRLSISPHADRFVLKGALLMLVWLGEAIRPTRDGDLLGFGDLSRQSLTSILQEICGVEVEPDGIEFLPASIRVVPIRPENVYGGMRATLDARLGKARLRVQLDVGLGDAVIPEPEWLEYPSLLEFPRPRLKAYRPETAIAEKLHAMVVLGEANSRMRDFFDVFALAERLPFEGRHLAEAVRATFGRRQTTIPGSAPLALRPEFAALPDKQVQWRVFLRKNGLSSAPAELSSVVARIAEFLAPVVAASSRPASFGDTWRAGGPWKRKRKAR